MPQSLHEPAVYGYHGVKVLGLFGGVGFKYSLSLHADPVSHVADIPVANDEHRGVSVNLDFCQRAVDYFDSFFQGWMTKVCTG